MAWGSSPVSSFSEYLGQNGGTSATSFSSASADTIFLTVASNNTNALTVSDSKGNTWTLIRSQDNGFGIMNYLYRTDTPAVVGSSHTFTVTGTSTFASISITCFAGGATSSIDDQENSAGTIFSQTIQPGSITPSEANTLIITGITATDDNREPTTINSSFTVATSRSAPSGLNVGIAYLVQGSAAAVNPTWTLANGSATHLDTTIANFRPAGAAATVVLPSRANPSQAVRRAAFH